MSNEGNETTPKPAAKRQKRQRGAAKTALAVLEVHLKGLFEQMDKVKRAVEELKTSL